MEQSLCPICQSNGTCSCERIPKRKRSPDLSESLLFNSAKKPLLNSLEPEENAACGLCGQVPVDLCSCVFPPLLLCSACRQKHIASTSEEPHVFFPVIERENLTSERDCVYARTKILVLQYAAKTLKQHIPDMDTCTNQLEAAYDALFLRLSDLKSTQITHIKAARKLLEDRIHASFLAVRRHIFDKEFVPFDKIEDIIWNATFDTDETAFQVCDFKVSSEYQEKALEKLIKSKFSIESLEFVVDLREENRPSDLVDSEEKSINTEHSSALLEEQGLNIEEQMRFFTVKEKKNHYKETLICLQAVERAKNILEEEMSVHMMENGLELIRDRAKSLVSKFCGEKMKTVPEVHLTRILQWTEKTWKRYSRYLELTSELKALKAQLDAFTLAKATGASEGGNMKCGYCDHYSVSVIRCMCGSVRNRQMTYCSEQCFGNDKRFHSCGSK